MNGINDEVKTLDSSFCINFLNGKIDSIPEGKHFLSVITRVEMYADPKTTAAKKQKIDKFLEDVTVVPFEEEIEQHTIRIRRSNTAIKLPDAIIAATALALGVKLLSCDKDLVSQLKVAAPELCAEYVKPLDSPV